MNDGIEGESGHRPGHGAEPSTAGAEWDLSESRIGDLTLIQRSMTSRWARSVRRPSGTQRRPLEGTYRPEDRAPKERAWTRRSALSRSASHRTRELGASRRARFPCPCGGCRPRYPHQLFGRHPVATEGEIVGLAPYLVRLLPEARHQSQRHGSQRRRGALNGADDRGALGNGLRVAVLPDQSEMAMVDM